MVHFNSLTATTELQAVNQMLAAIGEAPISQSELDTPARSDVEIAVDVMRNIVVETLAEGWKFNVQWGYELLPSPDSPYTHLFRDGTTNDLNIFEAPADLIAYKLSKTTNQQGTRFKSTTLRSLQYANGIIINGDLAVTTPTNKFKTTATMSYRIIGATYSLTAQAALTFSAADTINTGAASGYFWGAWLVQVNPSGTISTKSPSSDQVYTTKLAAFNAVQALSPDTNNIVIGYIYVQSNADVDWVANTDDLVAGSDCAYVEFVDENEVGLVIWNTSDQTDGFDEDDYPFLYIDYIRYVDFDECPETFRQFVARAAARRFCQITVGDPDLSGFTQRDERIAYRRLKREQGEKDNYNHFNNLGTFQHLGRYRVYRPEGVYDDRDSMGV